MPYQQTAVVLELVYAASVLAGAFVVPLFFSRGSLLGSIRALNRFEGEGRDRLFLPLTSGLARLGLRPNTITACGAALSFVLAAGFAGHWSAGTLFLLALAAGLTDMFDGMLARATGTVSSLGGALDGLRDLILFSVLSLGLLFETRGDMIFLYFFSGALFIEMLKVVEILVRARFYGLRQSFTMRAAGKGKLSADRVKFFFYIAGCLGFLFEEAVFGGRVGIGISLLWAGIAVIIISLAMHAAVIRLELEGESGMMKNTL